MPVLNRLNKIQRIQCWKKQTTSTIGGAVYNRALSKNSQSAFRKACAANKRPNEPKVKNVTLTTAELNLSPPAACEEKVGMKIPNA